MNSVFNVHTVACYLHHLTEDISPIKLQKGLYFLFAYYGATYSAEDSNGICEGSYKHPKYLFDATFEAWKYGPVVKEVYAACKQNTYSPTKIHEAVNEVEGNSEIKHFIQEIFGQVSSVSDFGLVDRSHQDHTWQNAYRNRKEGSIAEMNKDDIIREYVKRYVAVE